MTAQKKQSNVLSILLPLSSGILLLGLVALAFYQFYESMSSATNDIVVEHVEDLAEIFKRIDRTAKIIDFEHEKNYIDFLTVKEFVGSEVGAMNLQYPDKWEGPYVKDNPTMQEQYYVVVIAQQGWYIAPGDGVKLSGGKVIGKDIILNKDTDFEKLTQDRDLLLHNNQPLARKIR